MAMVTSYILCICWTYRSNIDSDEYYSYLKLLHTFVIMLRQSSQLYSYTDSLCFYIVIIGSYCHIRNYQSMHSDWPWYLIKILSVAQKSSHLHNMNQSLLTLCSQTVGTSFMCAINNICVSNDIECRRFCFISIVYLYMSVTFVNRSLSSSNMVCTYIHVHIAVDFPLSELQLQ